MREKVVIFIDRIAPKNILQVKTIQKLQLQADFFVTEFNNTILGTLSESNSQMLLNNNFLKRLDQIYNYLKKNKKEIHHLEIYPAGRFAFIYMLLGFVFNQKIICVERGDIQYYEKRFYGRWTRFSMWMCYKFSTIIWYREYYMKDLLKTITTKKLFFLHNAIEPQDDSKTEWLHSKEKKDIDFLWLNRVIEERRSDWYISVLKKNELNNTNNYLIGMVDKTLHIPNQQFVRKNKPANLTILNYTREPNKYYRRSKFFVLPADIVFANNSLLEAMSYGVVPIISDKPGSYQIVEDGENGFVFQHNEQAFQETVLKAIDLNETEYNRLSIAARKKIIRDFSPQKYFDGLKEMYSSI